MQLLLPPVLLSLENKTKAKHKHLLAAKTASYSWFKKKLLTSDRGKKVIPWTQHWRDSNVLDEAVPKNKLLEWDHQLNFMLSFSGRYLYKWSNGYITETCLCSPCMVLCLFPQKGELGMYLKMSRLHKRIIFTQLSQSKKVYNGEMPRSSEYSRNKQCNCK